MGKWISNKRAGMGLLPAVVLATVMALAAVCGVVLALAMTGAPDASQAQQGSAPEGPAAEDDSAMVPFGSVVANLAEGRLTRYVKVNITLRVPKDASSAVKAAVEGGKKAVFKNWLITYLSDKQLEDVKGTTAMNRLRREIRDGFNSILAEEGDLRVEQVLFEEFNIQ